MKLVFITRKIDRGDWLTGFVFTWLEKLAGQLEKLYVICQEKGDASGLPANVEVHSFGKEKGYGKLRQGYQLLIMSYRLGRQADGFFVHMHPIYAVTAALPAKILGKKLVLWYMHKSVDLKLKIAHALVDEVLTASKESFRLPSKKVKIVGHGIDLEKFIPHPRPLSPGGGERVGERSKFRILSIGRISPIKDYETLLQAARILYHDKGIRDFEVEIYGKIGLKKQQSYLDSLVEFTHNADLEGVVKFQGELNYEYVDETYQEADLFVNMSQTGSLDKAVLEAAATGIPAMTSNDAFEKSLLAISPLLYFQRNNPQQLADRILTIKALPGDERRYLGEALRAWVEKEHNLDNLVQIIKNEFTR